MERMYLSIAFASIVVLVAAIALIGPPTNERAQKTAVAFVMRQ
jgi:hypothetical protein